MFQVKVRAEEMERKGKRLLHFEIGDSYFDAPKQVKKATIKAIKDNKTHYTDPKGIYELRKAIAEKHNVLVENVCVCPANFGIFALLSVLCNKGDKVDYPVPGFPTYKAVCSYLGLKRGKKGKVTIINTPNNPTGKRIEKIKSKHTMGIFDFAYDEIQYIPQDEREISGAAFIYSFSKSHSMPGFRLGYVLSTSDVINKMGLLIETTYSCLPEFIQWAGIEALKIREYKLEELRYKRNLMFDILKKHYDIEKPEGAIYCWCKCKNGDKEFERLLEKGIVCCPGSIFGKKNYIRFCFAKSNEEIKRLGELL